MRLSSRKKLLKDFIAHRWEQFIHDDDEQMVLPEISNFPGKAASSKLSTYKKICIGDKASSHVKIITKNKDHEAFIWKTTPQKLSEATRWGVIHTESITSKVIGALGQYRVAAHETIAKGMISNTHATKMALLDLYQDRFEKLQPLESLINQKQSLADIVAALRTYAIHLEEIRDSISERFADTDIDTLSPKAVTRMQADMNADLKRVADLLKRINKYKNVEDLTRARGVFSILEFVKSQMLINLYELQGTNQDISFSTKRRFALTRGKLNDYIEDARAEINDHQPDLHNVVNAKHHGHYSNNHNQVIYDFSKDHMTADEQRKAMLAISFIEGWDRLNGHKLESPYGSVDLQQIYATRWQVSRNFRAFMRKIGIKLLNLLKSFVISTKPWQEDAWPYQPGGNQFHLVTNELHDHSKPNKPIWHTPVAIFRRIIRGFKDMLYGVYNSGKELIKTPIELVTDWHSTKALPPLEYVMQDANQLFNRIHEVEKHRLNSMLAEVASKKKIDVETLYRKDKNPEADLAPIAHQDYLLTAGDTNDILNSLVRGMHEVSHFFTRTLFAKNPVAGCVFVAAYGVAGATILVPQYVSALGSQFLAWQAKFGAVMAGSKFSSAISVASIEGQVMALAADGMMHGPTGWMGGILDEFAKNPLQIVTIGGIAYATGYILAETGIPVIGDILREETRGNPMNLTVLGGKSILASYALFHKNKPYKFVETEFSVNGNEVKQFPLVWELNKEFIERFQFVKWLSENYKMLPKLPAEMRCNIERHIDRLFEREEAKSLYKLIRHEKSRSIAFQLFYIPLSYIPSLLRIIASFFVSAMALIARQPHPAQPIRNAFFALGMQTSKDLSRLAFFLTELKRFVVSFVSSMIKMVAFTIEMGVARIASLFNQHPGHAVHRFFAHMHLGLRKLGEILYPTPAAKHIATANPKSTVNQYEASYRKILLGLNIDGIIPGEHVAHTMNNAQEPVVIMVDSDKILEHEFDQSTIRLHKNEVHPPLAQCGV